MTVFSFPNAIEARSGSRNNVLIYAEIRSIEGVILTAIDSGLLSVTVNNTGMTDIAIDSETSDPYGKPYYQVWQGNSNDRALADQMNQVIGYFVDLGYSITRKLNTNTNETFVWEILW